MSGNFSNFGLTPDEPAAWAGFGRNWAYYDVGDEVGITGNITYEDTDNGWRPTGHEIKTYRVVNSRKEAILARLVGKWIDKQPGTPARCEFIRDDKGIKLVPPYGRMLPGDDAYLVYKSGKLFGTFVAGRAYAPFLVHFTIEPTDNNTFLYDDSTWKREYQKQQ